MSYRTLSLILALPLLLAACNDRSRRMPPIVDDTGTITTDGGADTSPPSDTSPPPDTSVPPDTTPPPGCTVPSDCNDGITCTDDICVGGTCRNNPNNGLCEMGMTCELGVGCTGMACDETPCRLFAPQCGCGPGEGCYPTGDTTRGCAPAGTAVEGSSCSPSVECEPGSICAGVGVASCLRVCRSDSDCPGTTNLCASTFADGVTRLCSGTCDPIAQTGCPSGAMCRVYREDSGARRGYTGCWGPIGSGGQGSACTDHDDCARGYICGGTICHKWCRTGFAGDCPSGTTCSAIADAIPVGSVSYNLCN